MSSAVILLLACATIGHGQELEVKVGGTLGITGNFQDAAKQAKMGFEVVRDQVNKGVLRTASGKTIRVVLDIQDDESGTSDEILHPLYEDILTRGSQVLLAPYSSGATESASSVAKARGRVMMAHNAASPSVYDRTKTNNSWLFSTDVMATRYMENALDMLKERNPNLRVASAYNAESSFHQATCAGAVDYARSIGLTVIGNFPAGAFELAANVRTLTQLGPDIFLACGHLQDAQKVVFAARAFNFAPQVMVVTQSTTESFWSVTGPPVANYLLAPVTWHKDTRETHGGLPPQQIFTSNADYVSKFTSLHGIEPTYHSASAAAALMAILFAVKRLDAVEPPSALRAELLALDELSFYKRLSFLSDNGTLKSQTVFTEQVQPLGETPDPFERYLRSNVQLVSDRPDQLLWPMPNWPDKELEVYPCVPGWIVNHTDSGNPFCSPCEIGTLRTKSFLLCSNCGSGEYSDEEGATVCKLCPEGAECGENKVKGVPAAKGGHHKLPHSMQYPACDPPHICLGDGGCMDKHTGVLCSRCIPGYNRGRLFHASKADCEKCWGRSIRTFFVVIFIVALSLYIAFIQLLTMASSQSVRAIHSIIIKKMVNHVHFVAAVVIAMDLRDYGTMTYFAEAALEPMSAFITIDCWLSEGGWKAYQLEVAVAFAALPVILGATLLIFAMLLFFRLRSFLKEMGRRAQIISVGKDSSSAGGGGDESSSSSSEEDGPTVQLRWKNLQDTLAHAIQWGVLWVFVLHPLVVKMLLEGVTCAQLDVLRLAGHLDTECFEGDHWFWFEVACGGLALYGVGLPLVLGLLLRRVRHRLMDLPVRRVYGFLYNGFKGHWYYYEIVHMLLKVFMLVFASIPSRYVRLVSMLFLSFCALSMHVWADPYDSRDFYVLDRLETLTLATVIILLQTQLFFDLREETRETSPYVHRILSYGLFDVVLVAGCIISFTWFWLTAVWSIFRSTVMKLVHIKHEVGAQLNRIENFILWLEPSHHKVEFDPDTHAINLVNLTWRERRYLRVVLCDTMEAYIQSDKHFHPGRVLTALKRAMAICVKDRTARAIRVRHMQWEALGKKGVVGKAQHWLNLFMTTVLVDRADDHHGLAGMSRKRLPLRITENAATVEELQNALMLCWPEILEHRYRFFQIDKPPQALVVNKAAAAAARELQRRKTIMAIVEEEEEVAEEEEPAPPPRVSPEELTETYDEAVPRALVASTMQLHTREVQLIQEAWLSAYERQAFQQFLGAAEGRTDVEVHFLTGHMSVHKTVESGHLRYQHEAVSGELARTVLAAGIASSTRGDGVNEEINMVVKALMEREMWAQAARIRATAARLLAMQWARRITGGPGRSRFDNKEFSEFGEGKNADFEGKVLVMLSRGKGWMNLSHLAVAASNQLRGIATDLRDQGLEREGNYLETAALQLVIGLREEELQQPDMEVPTLQEQQAGRAAPPAEEAEENDEEGARSLEQRVQNLVIRIRTVQRLEEAAMIELNCKRFMMLQRLCEKSPADAEEVDDDIARSSSLSILVKAAGAGGSSPTGRSTGSTSPTGRAAAKRKAHAQDQPKKTTSKLAEQLQTMVQIHNLESDPRLKDIGPMAEHCKVELAKASERLHMEGLGEDARELDDLVKELGQAVLDSVKARAQEAEGEQDGGLTPRATASMKAAQRAMGRT